MNLSIACRSGLCVVLAVAFAAAVAGTAAAQVVDPLARIGQLEEQNRILNGRIEELTFQMLQMQEQIRQMQEDNEFRFQALEGGVISDDPAPAGDDRSDAGPAPAGDQAAVLPSNDRPPGSNPSSDAGTSPGATQGSLGTIRVDEDGTIVGADRTVGEIAALSSPEDIYAVGYDYILAGDYPLAEATFEDYLEIYPDGPQAPDAKYWLGEAQFATGQFSEAARTFLDAHQAHPTADKAPDMLFKLGMSLAALDNRETACATYQEVLLRYPDISPALRDRVGNEQSRIGC